MQSFWCNDNLLEEMNARMSQTREDRLNEARTKMNRRCYEHERCNRVSREQQHERLLKASIDRLSKKNKKSKQRIRELREQLKIASAIATQPSPQNSECRVCLDKGVEIVFITCGHACCCEECSKSLETCPMCRERIARKIKIYHS